MIIVFGACGFVGTYLIDELNKKKQKVIATDILEMVPFNEFYKKNLYMNLDITQKDNFNILPTEDVSCVVHLASLQPVNVKKENPVEYVETNINGTLNVLEYCRRNKIKKIIYISSIKSVLANNVEQEFLEEITKKNIIYGNEFTIFSITESCITDLIEYYSNKYKMYGIIFRVPPIYGYGPHLEGFSDGKPTKTGFLTFIEQAMKGETIEIWGVNYYMLTEFIYIKDVVSAIMKAIKVDRSGIFNISGKNPISLFDKVQEIIHIFSPKAKKSKVVFNLEKKNISKPFLLDLSRVKSYLDWYPKYDYHNMLIDFKKEMKSKKFEHLVKKRQELLKGV